MAYDERLAARIREVLDGRNDVTEKRMFGGVAFMVRGHMCAGIVKDDLMIRVGKDAYEGLVARPHARRMDFTGRPMTGFVFVAPAGVRTTSALRGWLRHALDHAESLPVKKKAPKKSSRAFMASTAQRPRRRPKPR